MLASFYIGTVYHFWQVQVFIVSVPRSQLDTGGAVAEGWCGGVHLLFPPHAP